MLRVERGNAVWRRVLPASFPTHTGEYTSYRLPRSASDFIPHAKREPPHRRSLLEFLSGVGRPRLYTFTRLNPLIRNVTVSLWGLSSRAARRSTSQMPCEARTRQRLPHRWMPAPASSVLGARIRVQLTGVTRFSPWPRGGPGLVRERTCPHQPTPRQSSRSLSTSPMRNWMTSELGSPRRAGPSRRPSGTSRRGHLRRRSRNWLATGPKEYDWRKVEAKLKALPHFTTEIDGLDIHFIHPRSSIRMPCRSS